MLEENNVKKILYHRDEIQVAEGSWEFWMRGKNSSSNYQMQYKIIQEISMEEQEAAENQRLEEEELDGVNGAANSDN